jgi:hypothetical protein
MFILSFFLILFSSIFVLSFINFKAKQENSPNFLYFLLIAFSQIVLSFEILSLMSLISKNNFLICNIIFFIVSLFLFCKTDKKIHLSSIKEEFQKIFFALKRDKFLLFLSICFVIFIVSQLISALFFPVTYGDALTYYLTRCTMWIQQGNINHFVTPDSRELIMPVNMEFLYTWLLLFRKSEIGIPIFAFIGYVGCIYVVYNFLKELAFSTRRRLWAIFVISSFVLVSIEMYTPCADLFIGALILSSVFLFLKSVKYDNKTNLYFASLSYALAVGTKTTSIIAIPSVFVVFVIFTYLYKKEHIYKTIFTFSGLFLLNFLIFSSYNYILNVIQFHNFVSCNEQFLLNQFRGGIKGWLATLIKYFFAIFDTSGLFDFINFNGFITYLQSLTLSVIGVTDRTFTSPYFARYFPFDSIYSISRSALGAMGLFAFLPSIVKSFKIAYKKASKRNIIMATLSLSLVLNLLIFARVMVFTQFNMRYLLTFTTIAFPVVVYSYIKKRTLFKIFLCFLMFIYLFLIPHKIPTAYIISAIKSMKTHKEFIIFNNDEINILNYMKSQGKKNIALIISQEKTPNYYIEKLRLYDFHLEKILLENIESYNLSNFDYIITNKLKVGSSNIVNFENMMKYPRKYVNRCLYLDYRQATIYDLNTKPAIAECEIPFDYIMQKGFKVDEDLKTNNYIIFKKTSSF